MSLMYAQMGLAVVNALSGHATASHEAKLAAMTQRYNNNMQAISLASTLNAQTENEVSVRDAGVRASESLQLQAMTDRAAGEVGAAAAGVRGNSVNSMMRGLSRSRLRAMAALKQRLLTQGQADLNTRRNLLMSAAYSKDVSVLPRASVASSLLGLGASMIDVYDRNQPEGQRTTDAVAGWGRP